MNFLSLIPLRAWLILGAVGVLGAILWHDHHLSQLLKSSRAETATERLRADQAVVQIKAEQEARAHEQTIAKQASDTYETELQRIRAAAAASPIVYRVRKCPGLSGSNGPATATGQPDAETQERVTGADEIDLGPAIDLYVQDCEANAAQLGSLQDWIKSR